MRRLFYVFCIVVVPAVLPAQIWDYFKIVKDSSNEYVEVLDYQLFLRPYYFSQYMTLGLKHDAITDPQPKYRPFVNDNLGFEVGTKYGSISMSLKFPGSLDKKNKYGDTKFTNLGLNLNLRSLKLQLFLQNYQGMYLRNANHFYPTWQRGDDYPKRADIKLTTFGIYTYLDFSKKYSFSSVFSLTEKQKKSCGSFHILFSNRFINLKTDSLLLLDQMQLYDDLIHFQKGFSNVISIMPGYSYVYVNGDYFVSPLLSVGPGIRASYNHFDHLARADFDMGFQFKANVKLAMGYNGDRLMGNIIGEMDFNNYQFGNDEKVFVRFFSVKAGMGIRI